MKLLWIPALLLSGCMQQQVSTNPPAPPMPWNVTVAQSSLALAHALNGATDGLIACRQQGKCDPADVTAAESVITAMATAGKGIDAELVSSDPLATQKTKILGLIAMSGVAQLKARVSPTTQLLIVSIIAVYDNISLAVGGPTF